MRARARARALSCSADGPAEFRHGTGEEVTRESGKIEGASRCIRRGYILVVRNYIFRLRTESQSNRVLFESCNHWCYKSAVNLKLFLIVLPVMFLKHTFSLLFFHSLVAFSAFPTDPLSGQQLVGQSFGVPGVNASYDYVIVGGGTAGLLLANRLSASPSITVAVVEAGGFYEFSNGNISAIPRYVWTGTGMGLDDANPLVDWMFTTQPEIGFGNQSIHYARGRALGGSSARNHIGYQRGTKGSYDKWAKDVGDDGFAWANLRKFFDRSITFHKVDGSKRRANSTPEDDPAGASATGGEVSVSYTNYVGPFTSWALRAVRALGMKAIPGYIGGELIGSSWDVRSVDPKTMVRDSAETAFLRPAMKRPNLVVYPNTMATKILFSGTKAVGIQLDTLGKTTQLKANNEVILSAGVFQSPQLLMVSGIGPKEVLSKYNIPVLVDLPGVGQNLQVIDPDFVPKIRG